MALQKLTKIDGGGISTTSDYQVGVVTTRGIKGIGIFSGGNVVHTGVITALNFLGNGNSFAIGGEANGVVDINIAGDIDSGGTSRFTNINTLGIITASNAYFLNNVTIGGTLAVHKDIHVGAGLSVVGIVTAKDIHVGAGLSVVGIVTSAAGDFVDLDVDGHTNLDNVSISGVTTIGNVVVGGATTDLIVEGNARVTGILSVGTGTVVIDETTVKTGTTNVHSVGVEAAGINVLGADTPIGTGATIYNSGAAIFTGIVTATSFDGPSQIGIQSGGIQIGAGITQLNFVGTGNTFAVNGTTVDVSIAGGGGGSGVGDADNLGSVAFIHYGGFESNDSVKFPQKFHEIFSHVDAAVDIEDGVNVDIDVDCLLVITDKNEFDSFANEIDKINYLGSSGFKDNARCVFDFDAELTALKKVGYVMIPIDYGDEVSCDIESGNTVSVGDMCVLNIGQ